jgi:hypothetical protein
MQARVAMACGHDVRLPECGVCFGYHFMFSRIRFKETHVRSSSSVFFNRSGH